MTCKWRPMKSAPKDGTLVVLGLWVTNIGNNKQHWEQYLGYFDPEDGCAYAPDFESLPWEWDDFEQWAPVPPEPQQLSESEKGGK